MKTKDLTYENWLEGKFELDSVYRITDFRPPKKPMAESELPPVVSEDKVGELELQKIKEEQSELFKSMVDELSQKFIDDFNERYTRSEYPRETLRIEANKIIATLRGKKLQISSEECQVEKTGQLMAFKFAKNLEYYVNGLLRGEPKSTKFVASPNSFYFNSSKAVYPQVFAESLVRLYGYLNKYNDSIDVIQLYKDEIQMFYKDIPYNPHESIFTSGFGYHLFVNLEEILGLPDIDNKPGDYVMIFKMLSHPVANAIHNGLSLKEYFDFINKTRKIDLNPKSNRASSSLLKDNILKYFLIRYFYQTKTILDDEVYELVDRVLQQKTT